MWKTNLAKLIEKNNYTLDSLSEVTKINLETISSIVKNKHKLDNYQAKIIGEALYVDPDSLIIEQVYEFNFPVDYSHFTTCAHFLEIFSYLRKGNLPILSDYDDYSIYSLIVDDIFGFDSTTKYSEMLLARAQDKVVRLNNKKIAKSSTYLSYLWFSLMYKKYTEQKYLDTSFKFNKARSHDKLTKQVLDIFFGNVYSFELKLQKIQEVCATRGIIVGYGKFIAGSKVNVASFIDKKKGRSFIFINDRHKREHAFIFWLITAILSFFFKTSATFKAANYITSYMEDKNKLNERVDLKLAFATHRRSITLNYDEKSDAWSKLYIASKPWKLVLPDEFDVMHTIDNLIEQKYH